MATRKQPERRPKGTSFAKRALRAVGNTISRHPSIAGGVVAGAVIFGYVAMNAMYQPGKHPSPWFVTRDDSVRQVAAVRQAVPVPENTVTTFKIERADAPAPVSDTQDTLVAQLQEALRARGIYDGIADGVAGPQTREAIRGYQVQSGLEPTGEPTDALLVHILITNLESVATPQGRPEPEALTIPRPSSLTPAESGSDLILDIQTGLSNIAYADIKVDGIAGEQTRAAIADFQKHYRLRSPASRIRRCWKSSRKSARCKGACCPVLQAIGSRGRLCGYDASDVRSLGQSADSTPLWRRRLCRG